MAVQEEAERPKRHRIAEDVVVGNVVHVEPVAVPVEGGARPTKDEVIHNLMVANYWAGYWAGKLSSYE